MKKKLRLKPFVFPTIYMILVLVLLGVVYYNGLISSNYEDSEDNELRYVTKLDLLDPVPVVNDEEIMVRPYNSEEVTIGKNYYDAQSPVEDQEKAIIYYEGTYIQNSGVDYVSANSFDVVSCLDGTVISANKSELMGYVVEVKYNNDIIISYQSLSEVNVQVNDVVSKGQKIGVSGTSSIGSELGNHLHLEMYHNGVTVNPEVYYNTNIRNI